MKTQLQSPKIKTNVNLNFVDRRGIDVFPFNPICPLCKTTMMFTGYCSGYEETTKGRSYMQLREFYHCQTCAKGFIRPLKRRNI